jgi:hypothetical protein
MDWLSTKFALIFRNIRNANFPYCIVGFRLGGPEDRKDVDVLSWRFADLK